MADTLLIRIPLTFTHRRGTKAAEVFSFRVFSLNQYPVPDTTELRGFAPIGMLE
jgi:hypothetical protein